MPDATGQALRWLCRADQACVTHLPDRFRTHLPVRQSERLEPARGSVSTMSLFAGGIFAHVLPRYHVAFAMPPKGI